MGGADISMLQVNYETNLKSGDGSVGILFEGFHLNKLPHKLQFFLG